MLMRTMGHFSETMIQARAQHWNMEIVGCLCAAAVSGIKHLLKAYMS